jgi:serine/threonine protein kinase
MKLRRLESARAKDNKTDGKKVSFSDRKNEMCYEDAKDSLISCLIISFAEQTIKEFRSVKELLTVLHDAIKIHQFLLDKVKILHRDISENNIIITDLGTANDFSDMLIDLDLVKFNDERTTERHMIDHAR